MLLRKIFIRKEEYIKPGERPDLEVEAIKIALKDKTEYCFKEEETHSYDSRDSKKKILVGLNTLMDYCEKHNIHYEPGTNPENGFDMVTVFPEKRAV